MPRLVDAEATEVDEMSIQFGLKGSVIAFLNVRWA